jgi:uncharacterized protein YndB with AHSA1/START domain
MAAKQEPVKPVKELTFTRMLDAPRELVFRAWTDPAHLARWWGPRGFTNPVCQLDARPGGTIRIDMLGPDGRYFLMGGEYREIVPPERLVFTITAVRNAGGEPELVNVNTVTFEPADGKTRLTFRTQVLKAGPGSEEFMAGMEEGWSQTLDRLGEEIAKG